MARSKKPTGTKKTKAHTPKVAVAPPKWPSKREKKMNLTKKQLIQQEKAARKRRNASNQEDVASLFGPLHNSNIGKSKKKKAPKNNSSNNNSNSNGKPPRKNNNKSNNRNHDNFTVIFDGAPLHAHQKRPRNNSNNNNTYSNSRPKPNNFQLQTITNPKGCVVPWWTDDDRKQWSNNRKKQRKKSNNNDTATNTKQRRHYLFGGQPPHEQWLAQLDAELDKFARYVQLSPSEQQARQFIVSSIEAVSRTNLECAKQSTSDQNDKIKVQVFGSFATQSVCAFCSDVDMALYGLVDPPSDDNDDDDSSVEVVARATHTRFGTTKKFVTTNKGSKSRDPEWDDKVKKWTELLQQHDSKEEEAKEEETETETHHDEHDEWQTELDAMLVGANEGPDSFHDPTDVSKLAKDNSKDDVVDLTATSKDEDDEDDNDNDEDKKPAAVEKKPSSSKEIINVDASSPDRNVKKSAAAVARVVSVGDSIHDNDDNDETEEGDSKLPAKETAQEDDEDDAGDFFVVDRVGVDDDDEENDAEEEEAVAAALDKALSEVPVEQPDTPTTTDTIMSRKRSLPDANNDENNHSGSDSEDDYADKLASLKTRKAGPPAGVSARNNNEPKQPKEEDPPEPEQAVISLSSDDEEEGGEEEEEEDVDDMHVSFVSHPPARTKKPATMGPTGAVRAEVVNVLSNLGNVLRRRQYTQSVTVIRKARVPIVKFQTKMGFEGDIAMGGHNGTDTSQFALTQVERFESFSTVVMALKIMLRQQNLDTPFHGGLGSYKLYVLVAHHLERHLELGGSDRPGEVFLSFLYRYGQIRRGIGILDDCHVKARTFLTQNAVLECCEGDYSADMSATFLLRHCIDLFRRCFMQVAQESTYTKAPKKGTSILRVLFDVEKLVDDRTESMAKAALLDVFHKGKKKEGQARQEQQQQQQRRNKSNDGGANESKSKRRKTR